jgi:hypothetical protein
MSTLFRELSPGVSAAFRVAMLCVRARVWCKSAVDVVRSTTSKRCAKPRTYL